VIAAIGALCGVALGAAVGTRLSAYDPSVPAVQVMALEPECVNLGPGDLDGFQSNGSRPLVTNWSRRGPVPTS